MSGPKQQNNPPKPRGDQLFRHSPLDSTTKVMNNINTGYLGQCSVLQDTSTQKFLLLKEVVYNTEEEFIMGVLYLQRKKALRHDGLLYVIDYSAEKINNFCASFYKTKVYFLPHLQELRKLAKDRQTKNKPFTEEEMTFLLFHTVNGLAELHRAGFTHNQISPESIDTTNLEGRNPKLIHFDEDLNSNVRQVAYNNIFKVKDLYLAPEIFQRTSELTKAKVPLHFDEQKLDSFSLGMTLLYAGVGKSIQDCYDTKKYIFNEQALRSHMSEFSQRYGNNPLLTDSLERLLDLSVEKRASPLALQAELPSVDEVNTYFDITKSESEDYNMIYPISQDDLRNGEAALKYYYSIGRVFSPPTQAQVYTSNYSGAAQGNAAGSVSGGKTNQQTGAQGGQINSQWSSSQSNLPNGPINSTQSSSSGQFVGQQGVGTSGPQFQNNGPIQQGHEPANFNNQGFAQTQGQQQTQGQSQVNNQDYSNSQGQGFGVNQGQNLNQNQGNAQGFTHTQGQSPLNNQDYSGNQGQGFGLNPAQAQGFTSVQGQQKTQGQSQTTNQDYSSSQGQALTQNQGQTQGFAFNQGANLNNQGVSLNQFQLPGQTIENHSHTNQLGTLNNQFQQQQGGFIPGPSGTFKQGPQGGNIPGIPSAFNNFSPALLPNQTGIQNEQNGWNAQGSAAPQLPGGWNINDPAQSWGQQNWNQQLQNNANQQQNDSTQQQWNHQQGPSTQQVGGWQSQSNNTMDAFTYPGNSRVNSSTPTTQPLQQPQFQPVPSLANNNIWNPPVPPTVEAIPQSNQGWASQGSNSPDSQVAFKSKGIHLITSQNNSIGLNPKSGPNNIDESQSNISYQQAVSKGFPGSLQDFQNWLQSTQTVGNGQMQNQGNSQFQSEFQGQTQGQAIAQNQPQKGLSLQDQSKSQRQVGPVMANHAIFEKTMSSLPMTQQNFNQQPIQQQDFTSTPSNEYLKRSASQPTRIGIPEPSSSSGSSQLLIAPQGAPQGGPIYTPSLPRPASVTHLSMNQPTTYQSGGFIVQNNSGIPPMSPTRGGQIAVANFSTQPPLSATSDSARRVRSSSHNIIRGGMVVAVNNPSEELRASRIVVSKDRVDYIMDDKHMGSPVVKTMIGPHSVINSPLVVSHSPLPAIFNQGHIPVAAVPSYHKISSSSSTSTPMVSYPSPSYTSTAFYHPTQSFSSSTMRIQHQIPGKYTPVPQYPSSGRLYPPGAVTRVSGVSHVQGPTNIGARIQVAGSGYSPNRNVIFAQQNGAPHISRKVVDTRSPPPPLAGRKREDSDIKPRELDSEDPQALADPVWNE